MAKAKVVKEEVNKESTSGGIDPKLAGLLSWIFTPVASLIFLLLEETKEDEFVMFHAKQSLFFFAAEIVIYILVGILTVISLGILSCLVPVISLADLGVRIYVGYKAYQGEHIKLPVIGDMAEK
jgi:uncharacterized membrane protein